MDTVLQALVHHGYLILFLSVLMDQIGLPVPALPVLVGAGALASLGYLSVPALLGVAVAAVLAADAVWFRLGASHGRRILAWLCRIAIEPDYCVRTTEDIFVRHGPGALLFAKFVPGLNAAAVPIAGMMKMPRVRFATFDFAGALLWSGSFIGLGYVFAGQLEQAGRLAFSFGTRLLFLPAGAFGAYIVFKYWKRRRSLPFSFDVDESMRADT